MTTPFPADQARRPARAYQRSLGLRAVAATIAIGAVFGLASCNSPQQVLDRADMCLKITDLALFNPHPVDADAAVKDVNDRADKIDELVKKAKDDKLKKAASDTANELRNTKLKDRDPGSVSVYVAGQNKRLESLRSTCTSAGDMAG
ncbi:MULTISPECIES: hypothetical protein [unclassified Kitasatospora]|uniref:hypothetical protein n=1 Tax=unclassified Kitasatospora TaxID=2633591 RepID=UPI0033C73FE4